MIQAKKTQLALIVDDARSVRLIMRQILGSLGFEVVEVADGREGLERLRELPPVDVAMVDGFMPGMDGVEFMRTVRANHKYDTMRMILVTSEQEANTVGGAIAAGADAFLKKPFSHQDVRDQLELLKMTLTKA